ncbi:MAG: hypothetical protein ACREM8_12980 [Vulcanimicrobiaceae bacterium]
MTIISSGSHEIDLEKLANIDDLMDLIEIEPDALREAEFVQAQAILETLHGKQIERATVEDTRIVIETTEGNRYFFYGFMGSGRPSGDEEASAT